MKIQRRIVILVALVAILAAGVSALPSPTSRAAGACTSPSDCLSKMSLDEKVGQMTQVEHGSIDCANITSYYIGSLLSGGGGAPSTGNTALDWADMYDGYQACALQTPLGIPLIYGVDAVHGHSNVYGATIFPHNIGLGATRNASLVQQIGHATAIEVAATGIDWTFAPCVAVPRNERWGRTYEGFAEIPAPAESLGAAYVQGFQGTNLSAPDTIAACTKHYVGDGGTTDGDDQGDTVVSEDELRQVHLAPYYDAIAAGTETIMISYNSWNGQKLHGHSYLINDVLKGEMGFDGFIVSDWAGIDQLPGDYASDVRESINAGIDMVMVPSNYTNFISTLKNEINAGNISMTRIDAAVTKILETKFALDLFDYPYTDRSYLNQVGSQAHRDLARQAVRESLVLLQNDGVLPLSKDLNEILVVGENADDIGNQCGGWTISWQGSSGDTTIGTTILEGIQSIVSSGTTVNYASRCRGPLGGNPDVVIAVVGERPYAEGQGDAGSESVLSIPMTCIDYAQTAGVPVVVVLVSGRPMLVDEAELSTWDAFVAAWLPGTEGDGVAEVLFGDYDFTGKLPHSWPRTWTQIPINSPDGPYGSTPYDPLFAYGYGLDYGGTQPTPTPTPSPTPGNTPTPTPTPTATPSGSTMHVADIAMVAVNAGGPNWQAIATVTVVDGSGNPVEGATVYGAFSGLVSKAFSKTTAADGTAEFSSPKSRSSGTITFCVDNITKDGYTYDEAANVETCDSVAGP
jgi:beta-glucosidase